MRIPFVLLVMAGVFFANGLGFAQDNMAPGTEDNADKASDRTSTKTADKQVVSGLANCDFVSAVDDKVPALPYPPTTQISTCGKNGSLWVADGVTARCRFGQATVYFEGVGCVLSELIPPSALNCVAHNVRGGYVRVTSKKDKNSLLFRPSAYSPQSPFAPPGTDSSGSE